MRAAAVIDRRRMAVTGWHYRMTMKTRAEAEAEAGGYSDSVRRLSVAADAERPSRRVASCVG